MTPDINNTSLPDTGDAAALAVEIRRNILIGEDDAHALAEALMPFLSARASVAVAVDETMVNRALDAADYCRNADTAAWMRKALEAALNQPS